MLSARAAGWSLPSTRRDPSLVTVWTNLGRYVTTRLPNSVQARPYLERVLGTESLRTEIHESRGGQDEDLQVFPI